MSFFSELDSVKKIFLQLFSIFSENEFEELIRHHENERNNSLSI